MSNTLGFKNGYAIQQLPTVGLGGERLTANQLSEAELDELAKQMPTLTYGQAKQAPPETFLPAHLAFDKKVTNKCSLCYTPICLELSNGISELALCLQISKLLVTPPNQVQKPIINFILRCPTAYFYPTKFMEPMTSEGKFCS